MRSLRDRGELEAGDVAVLIPNGRAVQRVGVEWTPCTFGGDRPWLLCPGCGRRVASSTMPARGSSAGAAAISRTERRT